MLPSTDRSDLTPIHATQLARGFPPQAYFVLSACFHYLGPAFATLLFTAMAPLGVAWLRIASAALIFAAWRKPWRLIPGFGRADWIAILGLGLSLAAMNVCFYLAIARLPLATVGAIEFLGPIALAASGVRTMRNFVALLFAISGIALLTKAHFSGAPLGYSFAFANCGLFVLYVIFGHRIASAGGSTGVDRLSAAMLVAMIAVLPIGFGAATPAFRCPRLLVAGLGVGISSSMIPYVADQFAMARLPRESFALMLALLPAMATLIGVVVLRQIPSTLELIGVGLVIMGVGIHRPRRTGSAA